jgi:hypothetical protein
VEVQLVDEPPLDVAAERAGQTVVADADGDAPLGHGDGDLELGVVDDIEVGAGERASDAGNRLARKLAIVVGEAGDDGPGGGFGGRDVATVETEELSVPGPAS